MSLKSRFPSPAVRCGLFLFPVLLSCCPVVCHAFTLDIASHEVAEIGQNPRLLYATGYGEVVFESGLDGTLVVASAYASTEPINVPPAASVEFVVESSPVNGVAHENQGFVEIANRTPNLSTPLRITPHPVDTTLKNTSGGWNAVPEAASATLGLFATLLWFLRRRVKEVSLRDVAPDEGVFPSA